MRLLAISDLHLEREPSRRAIENLAHHPKDWLILAGDIASNPDLFTWGLDRLNERFAQILWVPGNHELWTQPEDSKSLRGESRYRHFVELCRDRNVATPEDPYLLWPGQGPNCRLVPLFLLYDYSFGPDGLSPEEAVTWALEEDILCADERFLIPDPHSSREAWCSRRVSITLERLSEIDPAEPLILINHFPLRRDLVRIPRIPRFIIWCGTRNTEDWHRQFHTHAVVSGHLHVRATDWKDGVRFEEVSLGYPRQWNTDRDLSSYLRQILPDPESPPPGGDKAPIWRR
ncbi:MAG: metallophosphoesterase [Planctomycetota bacterium]|nr:metallophosphoesterase [Planctomycetota bacterium]